jgi:hypothetical protein
MLRFGQGHRRVEAVSLLLRALHMVLLAQTLVGRLGFQVLPMV